MLAQRQTGRGKSVANEILKWDEISIYTIQTNIYIFENLYCDWYLNINQQTPDVLQPSHKKIIWKGENIVSDKLFKC